MLTSRNDDLRWILATIVESGNRRLWGWTNCDELCFHSASFVLRDVFLASIFVAYVEPFFFFTFAQQNSPVELLLMALAALFPTKGELSSLHESLEKVSAMTLHGLSI